MSVFYVLPPRPVLGDCLARLLRLYVPGATISPDSCAEMVAALVSESPEGDELYVVHREDLPENEDVSGSLREGFGAETGDQIVEVSISLKPDEPQVNIWTLAAA